MRARKRSARTLTTASTVTELSIHLELEGSERALVAEIARVRRAIQREDNCDEGLERAVASISELDSDATLTHQRLTNVIDEALCNLPVPLREELSHYLPDGVSVEHIIPEELEKVIAKIGSLIEKIVGSVPAPVFCLCDRPYLHNAGMIQCCKCLDWYHWQCVRLVDAEISVLVRFTCPICDGSSTCLACIDKFFIGSLNFQKVADTSLSRAEATWDGDKPVHDPSLELDHWPKLMEIDDEHEAVNTSEVVPTYPVLSHTSYATASFIDAPRGLALRLAIRKLLQKQKITWEELARESGVGVTRKTVKRYVCGKPNVHSMRGKDNLLRDYFVRRASPTGIEQYLPSSEAISDECFRIETEYGVCINNEAEELFASKLTKKSDATRDYVDLGTDRHILNQKIDDRKGVDIEFPRGEIFRTAIIRYMKSQNITEQDIARCACVDEATVHYFLSGRGAELNGWQQKEENLLRWFVEASVPFGGITAYAHDDFKKKVNAPCGEDLRLAINRMITSQNIDFFDILSEVEIEGGIKTVQRYIDGCKVNNLPKIEATMRKWFFAKVNNIGLCMKFDLCQDCGVNALAGEELRLAVVRLVRNLKLKAHEILSECKVIGGSDTLRKYFRGIPINNLEEKESAIRSWFSERAGAEWRIFLMPDETELVDAQIPVGENLRLAVVRMVRDRKILPSAIVSESGVIGGYETIRRYLKGKPVHNIDEKEPIIRHWFARTAGEEFRNYLDHYEQVDENIPRGKELQRSVQLYCRKHGLQANDIVLHANAVCSEVTMRRYLAGSQIQRLQEQEPYIRAWFAQAVGTDYQMYLDGSVASASQPTIGDVIDDAVPTGEALRRAVVRLVKARQLKPYDIVRETKVIGGIDTVFCFLNGTPMCQFEKKEPCIRKWFATKTEGEGYGMYLDGGPVQRQLEEDEHNQRCRHTLRQRHKTDPESILNTRQPSIKDSIYVLDAATESWVVASVVDVEEKRVRVHFHGWNARFDEWIDTGSSRLSYENPILKRVDERAARSSHKRDHSSTFNTVDSPSSHHGRSLRRRK